MILFLLRHMQQGTPSCSCVAVTSVTPWSNLYDSTVTNGSGIPLRKDMIERELHVSMNQTIAD